jgi:hypothetical protein
MLYYSRHHPKEDIQMKKQIRFMPLALALTLGYTLSTNAESYSWNGAEGDSWSNGSSWLPIGVPGASDTAAFAASATIALPADATVSAIEVSENARVHLTGNGTKIAAREMDVNPARTIKPSFTVSSKEGRAYALTVGYRSSSAAEIAFSCDGSPAITVKLPANATRGIVQSPRPLAVPAGASVIRWALVSGAPDFQLVGLQLT